MLYGEDSKAWATGQVSSPPSPLPGTLVGPAAEVREIRMRGAPGDRGGLLRGKVIHV